MNIYRIDLNLLKVFLAIYEERQISAAADRLGQTQPGLSHALKRLRDLVGDEVFVRTARGMEPTRKANELYGRIRGSIGALNDALQFDEDFDPKTAERSFVIAANDYGAVALIPPLIRALEKHAPGIRIRTQHYEHGTQYEALRRGDVDLSLTIPQDIPGWVTVQTLFQETAVGLACPESHLLREGVTLRRFVAARHVIMTPSGMSTWLDDFLKARGLERNIAHTVPHFLAMPAAISGTDYVATMPRRLAAPLAKAYGLSMFELPADVPSHPIVQVWNSQWSNDKAHKWLRTTLNEAVRTTD